MMTTYDITHATWVNPPFIAKADAHHTICQPDGITEGDGYFEHDLRDWEEDERGRTYTICRAKLIGAVFTDDDGYEYSMTPDDMVDKFGLAWVKAQEDASAAKYEEANQ